MENFVTVDEGILMLNSSQISLFNATLMGDLVYENSDTDNAELRRINREKAELLAPAILYTVILMAIGTVGNPLAIFIYGWKWQNTTTRIFLFCLAWLDLLNCLVTMPTEIYAMSNLYYFPNASFCRLSRFITYVINNGTSAVFLVIALDRYIRICHPHRNAISILGAKIACAISLCVGIGVSWPALVLYGSSKVTLPSSSSKKGFIFGVICAVKNDMEHTPYPMAFFIYLWCGFSFCVFILAVIYILIGRVMLERRTDKKRKRRKTEETEGGARVEGEDHAFQPINNGNHNQNPARQEQEPDSGDTRCVKVINAASHSWKSNRMRPPKSTLMLFAITAVFVVTFMPFLVIMILREHRGRSFYPSLSPAEEVVVNVFSRSYLVNNCANPVVYGLFNSQFRDQVRKVFHIPTRSRDSSLSRDESRLSQGLSA